MFGEPLGHGWGIDLPGIGDSLRLTGVQAHSLKPDTAVNTDGHMVYREGKVEFTQDGAGRCLTARTNQSGSPLDADPCSDHGLQSFVMEVE